MSTPHWRNLGFLTPDAFEAQQDVWALHALLRERLADVLGALAAATAEPTWAASLGHAAQQAVLLRTALLDATHADALQRVADDDLVRAFDGAVTEVAVSGHVPSLIVTGFAVLGELGTLPLRLLHEVAGPHARILCGRVADSDEHRLLGRLFGIVHPTPTDAAALRRLLRYLNGQLGDVYRAWRQTFHCLGVDAEALLDEARDTVRKCHHVLGLPFSAHDARAFAHG